MDSSEKQRQLEVYVHQTGNSSYVVVQDLGALRQWM